MKTMSTVKAASRTVVLNWLAIVILPPVEKLWKLFQNFFM